MPESHFRPGMRLGSYPQKQENPLPPFEQTVTVAAKNIRNLLFRQRFSQKVVIKKIKQYEGPLSNCSEDALTIAILELKENLGRYGMTDNLVAQAFATIREVAGRTLG